MNLPTTSADCFFLGLDSFMRRRGQSGHTGVSVVLLEGDVDLISLRSSVSALTKEHPVVSAAARYSLRQFRSVWKTYEPQEIEVGESYIDDFQDIPNGAQTRSSLREFVSSELRAPHDIREPIPHIRLELLHLDSKKSALVITWHHAILDGIGINHLLSAIANQFGLKGVQIPPIPETAPINLALAKAAKPALEYLRGLKRDGVGSCGRPKHHAGDQCYEIVSLAPEETKEMLANLSPLGSEIALSPILLATVARAHLTILKERGESISSLVALAPMQLGKAFPRPIFQNHISSALTLLSPEDLTHLDGAVAAIQRKLAPFAFGKLKTGMQAMLNLMSRIPPCLHLAIPRVHFKGRFASFFQSYTGEFAPKIENFHGATILDGYNIPAVSSPPGTGAFFSVCRGRFSIILSWRSGALSDPEKRRMITLILDDLRG